MKNIRPTLIGVVLLAVTLTGCQTAAQHRAQVRDDSGEALTVGTVQRKIVVGMSGAEVAATLGSPNLVSTDEQRREVWVYDKISTETVYSTSSGGIGSLILGGLGGSAVGGVGSSFNSSAGAASRTQKTLTVIIKFDGTGSVRDFAYHTSRF